ncbi:MAG: hypothetical protein E7437_09185 [Ruminococcaceae bacterium]|nr:hypothetical protein [Oscillospiraceae bacterium]
MKKQDSPKKSRWLIPVAVVALLAVIGGALFLAFGGTEDAAPQTQATEPTAVQTEELRLYWNVDREAYAAKGYQGTSGRMPRSDGLYYIRFSIDAEQVDLPVRDKTLVDRIDMQDVMGLVLDEEGVVVDMRTVSECAGGFVAPTLFVKSADGNTLVVNTQGNFKGLDFTIQLNENTKIYDVGGEGLLIGMLGSVKTDDEILAVQDKDGNITHVFVKTYSMPSDIYWNLQRKYNSTTKLTTREASVTGVYEFDMSLNGEVVKVRTRDVSIASKMDSYSAKYMALTFDEDGYVIDCSQSNASCGVSGTFASWARVDEVSGDTFHAYNSRGVEFDGVISNHTKIIDCSAQYGYPGTLSELKVGDQIHCMLDKRGRISHLFIVSRCLNEKLYWNTERQYDSTNKVTKRIPDAQGYYWFTLATGGQQVKLRTNDREMATKIDGYATRCFALTVDGQDIQKFHYAEYVHGNNNPFGSWAYVDKLDGNKITVKKMNSTTKEVTYTEGVLSDQVEIINGSTNFISHCGEYSTLQVGDQIHGLRDYKGEIRVVYIVKKPYDCYIYWNMSRMYDSANKVTTRTPDADGWYHFRMARNDGVQVDLKTKDREMASKIDAEASKLWALTVYNGVIYKRSGTSNVRWLGGGSQGMSWVNVTSVTPYGFTAIKQQAGHANDGKTYSASFAWDYKVLNVSNGFASHLGEITDLRVGDQIHVLLNNDLQAKYIYVVGRRNPTYCTTQEDCPCTHKNAKWEPWDGTGPLTNGKYYYLTSDVVAPEEGFLIQNAAVHLRLDGHTISSPGRCFFTKSGGQLRICDHTGNGKLIGTGVEGESGGVIRMYSEVGGACTKLWNLEISTVGKKASQGGLISASAPLHLYNCTLHDGYASGAGGAIQVNPTGVLNAYNTTVSDCTGTTGGLINVTTGGTFYLENVTLADGQSAGNSDIMQIRSTGDMLMNGVTVTNSDTKGGSGINFLSGTVGLSGNIQITENGKSNVILGEGAVFTDMGLDGASRIGVQSPEQVILQNASADLSGCFVSYEPEDYIPVYDAEAKQVLFDCIITAKPHETDHCLCAGLGALGDHTCTTLTDWVEITDQVFEDAIGPDGKSKGLKFKEDGNYYLTLDYALTKRLNIMPGQKINLCLNGCDLTRSGQLIVCAGELNITDCRGSGKLIGASTDNGGTMKLVTGGTARLFAGTLTGQGQTCNSGGGILVVSNDQAEIVETNISEAAKRPASSFTMYGGAILDGSATRGGNVCLWHTASFTMYGGTVSGGTATTGAGGNIQMESSGKLQLLGGTISGGEALSGAGGIRVQKGQLTLGGDGKLSGNTGSDLSLASGLKITLDGYTGTEPVKLTMDAPGVFATTAQDLSTAFVSADGDMEVVQKNGELKLLFKSTAQGHIHCVCGGCADGKYGHECENVKFEEWDKTDSLPASGYYYLTEDVELSTAHQLGANNHLTICLNGHKITCKTSRAFWVNKNSGSLTLTSCQDGGEVAGAGVAGESGGVIRSGNEVPVLSLYNLTLTRIDDPENRVLVTEGGLVICSGFLNMYNVTATNGYAKTSGGIHCAYTCKAVIVDTSITGCTATGSGGGMTVTGAVTANPTEVTLVDTTITGNTAATGTDMYFIPGKAKLHLGGRIVTEGLYMSGTGNLSIMDMGLASDASIRLSMAGDGLVGSAMEDFSGLFTLDEDRTMVFDETAKTLTVVYGTVHSHCICGGLGAVGDHVCGEDVVWTPISDSVFTTRDGLYVFAEDGHYYLTEDYPSPKRITVLPDQNVSICLNGHTLSRGNGSTIFYVGGHANICDCVGGGVLTGNYAGDGGSVKLVSAASMNLFGGTLTRGSNKGCPVIISNDKEGIATTTITAVDERPASTFKMYGGAITGATTASNLKVVHSANFYMYGGAITGGHSNTYGGNLTLSTIGTVQLLGGTISGGTATTAGNDIYVSRGTVYAAASFLDKITLASGASVEEAES